MSKKNNNNNKYQLDAKVHRKSDELILDINVYYNIDEDEVFVDFGVRDDVKHYDLLYRAAQQVEHALRRHSSIYALNLSILERNAGIDNVTECGCDKCGKR